MKTYCLRSMVRRLIKNFLRWLRQLIARVRSTKPRHLPSSQQLPPASQRREPISRTPTEQQLSPPQQERLSPPSYPPKPPRPLPQKLTVPSNFTMRLSEYKYSPSAAIQGLNHQLTQPVAKDFKEQDPKADLAKQESATEQKSQPEYADGLSALKEQPFLPKQEIIHSQLQTTPVSPTESSEAALPAHQISAPSHHPSPSVPAEAETAAASGVIVKQGIVKLLFKLKKNNYHGYIAPRDGSKDIIFHQKYVGREVFSQLERGMEVEVTAHVTEGKAYADRIRIL